MKVNLDSLVGMGVAAGVTVAMGVYAINRLKSSFDRYKQPKSPFVSDEEIHHCELDGNAGYFEPNPEGGKGMDWKKIEEGEAYGALAVGRSLVREIRKEPAPVDDSTRMGDRTS
ncbi:MAG: hypothetical protein WCK90_02635 [archaeon]